MNTKKIGIYVRVSTENKGQDTGMQILDITKYLESKSLTGFQLYEDKGFSGTKKNRPSLKKLMEDCRQGKISMVICWKMDRLFRSLKDLMDTLAMFQEEKIEFVALKDGIDLSTATGRLMMQIIGAFAEFEAAVIKERVMSGIANARSKGIKLGRPFGKGHSGIIKMKSEGKTVREIAESTGLSKQTVYKALKPKELV